MFTTYISDLVFALSECSSEWGGGFKRGVSTKIIDGSEGVYEIYD